MEIPRKIQDIIGNKSGIQDNIGLSGASVYIFEEMVLKIQNNSKEADNEYTMMLWLNQKLPVPKIIEYDKTNKYSYLLMSKCPGVTACSDAMMTSPKQQSELLARALEEIWDVDWKDCPSDCSLDNKLLQAEYNVCNGLINVSDCEQETFCKHGFSSPETLLYWLKENKPEEELFLSHGDFCLPNVFFENGELSGLIDLGRMGVADKWCDIALCYRSLRNNYNGRYTGHRLSGYDESYLFNALQINIDWDKIRYYMLLDELL